LSDRFQTTRWSLVLAAAKGEHGSAEALEWLCATYWHPLYGFIRRHGNDPESARDLTQSFFLSLLGRNSLQSIDPSNGRFRAFLLASVKHFLSNERERAQALKRRADDIALHLDLEDAERMYLLEPAPGLGPEELFEAKWARTVLDRAMKRLREEHETTGRGDLFRRLSGHLTGEETPYGVLAGELDMSEGAIRVAVHRLRNRLGSLLRAEVAQTVADPRDVDGEIRHLLQAAGRVA